MIRLFKKIYKWIIFIILSGGIIYGASINVLTIHSHPKEGDFWRVTFETEGLRDLIITPEDQNTIDDMDFVSLKCGDKERVPQILENDVILYENWYCFEEAEIVHIINRTDHHYLKFQFGKQEAFAYNSPGLIDNLVSYWKLDDNLSTDVVLDAHGSDPGAVVNDQTNYSSEQSTTTAKIVRAFNLDGTNDYVITSAVDISGTDKITVSFWVRPNATSSGDDALIEMASRSQNYEDSFAIFFKENETVQAYAYGDVGYNIWQTSSTLTPDTWTHIVATCDKSLSTEECKVYFDGDLDGASTGADSNNTGNFGNRVIYFGSRVSESRYFNGILDEIAIWDRILTSTEITELYNSGNGLAYPFSVVARRDVYIE